MPSRLRQTEPVDRVLQQAVAYLTLTNVPAEQWAAAIDTQQRRIGRSKQAEIRVFPHMRHVSRLHAAVWADASGSLWIVDVGSTSGTRVNDVWVEPNHRVTLVPGDRIRLGYAELNVRAKLSALGQVIAETGLCFAELDASASRSMQVAPDVQQQRLRELTPSELGIVLWMVRGVFRNEDLAERLGRSANTVRTQLSYIFRKMQVSSRAELMALFRQGGSFSTSEGAYGRWQPNNGKTRC